MAWDPDTRKEVWKWGRDLALSIAVIPSLLLYADMSPLVIVAGGLVSLGLLKLWEWTPRAAYVTFAILTIVGTGWYFGAHTTWWQSAKTPTKLPPRIEAKLLIQCFEGPPPAVVPPNGRYPVIQLISINFRHTFGLIPYGEVFSEDPPGTPWKAAGDSVLFADRCEVTNYDTAALFRVQVAIQLEFQKAVAQPLSANVLTSGPTIFAGTFLYTIPRVDPGSSNPFVFYMWNVTNDEFVRIHLPTEVAGTRLGGEKPIQIKLIQIDQEDLSLGPAQLPKQKSPPQQQRQHPSRHAELSVTNSPGSIFAPHGGTNTITNNFGPSERTISTADAQSIADALRAIGPHKFTLVDYSGAQSQEVSNYKNRLAEILKAAGWSPEGSETITSLPAGAPPLVGLHFLTRTDSVPQADGSLYRILSDRHILMFNDYIKFPALIESDDTIGIAVGQAPLH